ncbi:hypothetical protein ACFOLC_00640 [Lysobacter cavernae]|uniref:Uncharacterized protein n=2 Tax=Lysobacter cavernae TaxID=1685901 RepID=A0ABV7RLG9_9GAMM
MRPYRSIVMPVSTALWMLITGSALASDFGPVPGLAECTEPPVLASAPSVPVQVIGMGQTINSDRLAGLRGGTDIDNDILVDGKVDNTSADRVVTGHNSINAGSFANSNGIVTTIQNTGANVLIQNAMIVNVQFAPPVP